MSNIKFEIGDIVKIKPDCMKNKSRYAYENVKDDVVMIC